MEIVPHDDKKENFMKELEQMRPDLMFADIWSQSDREYAVDQFRPAKIKSSMISMIPMICRSKNCFVADMCPLVKKGIAPEGLSCHPAGETVLTHQHGYVNIENLDPEIHTIYSWERKNNLLIKNKTNRDDGYNFTVSSKDYHGFLIALSTPDGSSHRVTHDHISAVRFNENAIGKFCVYLMRKDDFWRVGKSKIATETSDEAIDGGSKLSFTMRGIMENADAMWILGVYETNAEALLSEEFFSISLQTSKTSFVDSLEKIESKHNGVTKEQLFDHHKSLMQDEEFYRDQLYKLGLCIDFPIWKNGGFNDNDPATGPSVKWSMFMRACNIIPGIMDVPTIKHEVFSKNGQRQAFWQQVLIEKQEYCGRVYSLDVDNVHKTYFSGDIATHNCPIELSAALQFFNDYVEELDVDTSRMVEVSMVRDLVDQEIQQMRKTWVLSQEHFIQENVAGVDSDGNVVMKKELHQAIDYEERILKRKEKLRNALLATRESKAKTGQSTVDNSQYIANLMSEVRQIEIDLKEQIENEDIQDAEIIDDEE